MTNTTHTNRIIQLLVIAITALVLLLGSGWTTEAHAHQIVCPYGSHNCPR